ncbi:atpase-like protein [Diplodia corticola]|uniref:Atpase-like protein n=1 Tax=Diplodia corticola TaxID=236234 RepID=A0A1J9RCZ0_9PEZI|nr:atpase-like protein [Diplodia corticola]OJD30387.1 atpase-like protein [Diplodia corticola]
MDRCRDREDDAELQRFRELYHKLHNLEDFPAVFPQAKETLILLLSESLERTQQSTGLDIRSVDKYTREAASAFTQRRNIETLGRWQEYVTRRETGPRELVRTVSDATRWLRQNAPSKLVDGAWLGYVHRVTTPYALRPTTKIAWQIFSEELGDGDNAKNHVYLYRRLLGSSGIDMPESHSSAFLEPHHGMTDVRSWKSGVSQLLISLFPDDFLPEILGFNLHFEGLTLETMVLAKELEELKMDPSYFRLHITIDNAASGHTAMAVAAVDSYMQHLGASAGEAAVQAAWRRVQAGYVLSEYLGEDASPSPSEAEVASVFLQKVNVSQNMHCSCRAKIEGRTLEEWLDPKEFSNREWHMSFLGALGRSRVWVRRGNSAQSRLMKELMWGGKMFGSFTEQEVEVVRRWIDGLGGPRPDSTAYWAFVNREPDQLALHSCVSAASDAAFPTLCVPSDLPAALPPIRRPAIRAVQDLRVSRFFGIWFMHPCLLETAIAVPSRAANLHMACLLKLIRAQNGLGKEGSGVAGMDEVKRLEAAGLVELGLRMATAVRGAAPGCLADVVEADADYAVLLKLASSPKRHFPVLLGLSWAFVGLHQAVANSALLDAGGQAMLRDIASREASSLAECIALSGAMGSANADVCEGFRLGTFFIDSCIENGELL